MFTVHGNGFLLCRSFLLIGAIYTYLKYKKDCYCVIRFLGIPIKKSGW